MAEPQVAANLARLAEETGIPEEQYRAWQSQPAPLDMDPELWAGALAERGRLHGPWTESALQALTRMAADPEARAA